MNTSEKGQSFEKAVESALAAFYEPSSLNDFVTIEHNVSEVGRSGQGHQIDIRLQIHAGITALKLLCECKCYGNRVPLTDVLALKARVDDCNAAGGILITNKGFQKGAAIFAQKNGITLLTLKGQEIVAWGGEGGSSGPYKRLRIRDVVSNLVRLFTFGRRSRMLNGGQVWTIVSNLTRVWQHPLPIGVNFCLFSQPQKMWSKLLIGASEWVHAVEVNWNGISILFHDFDFRLDGSPAEFIGQQNTCFANEDGLTIPAHSIRKILLFKALMDHASHEQSKGQIRKTD